MSKKGSVSELTAHIGFWMRMVSNSVSFAFADKLKAKDVTVAEWVVMRELYGVDRSVSSSHIADLTGLTRGAVSKLIARLGKKELVTCEESKEDRRFQEIALTTKGEQLVPLLALLADQNEGEFFSVLTQEERKSLRCLLEKTASAHRWNRAPID